MTAFLLSNQGQLIITASVIGVIVAVLVAIETRKYLAPRRDERRIIAEVRRAGDAIEVREWPAGARAGATASGKRQVSA